MNKTIDFGIYTSLEWNKLSTEYLHGLADMGNTKAQEQLAKVYSAPIHEQKIGFGKYSGFLWVDLEVDYLCWIRDAVDKKNIKHTLAVKALNFIDENSYEKVGQDEFGDVIYVD